MTTEGGLIAYVLVGSTLAGALWAFDYDDVEAALMGVFWPVILPGFATCKIIRHIMEQQRLRAIRRADAEREQARLLREAGLD